MSTYNFLFRYIVIGDSGVGKSSILLRFMDDQFTEKHKATIGMEFVSKNLKIKNKTIKLQIWDTAGQEQFRSITRSYYKGAIGAILVYDITRRESFENASKWLEETRQYSSSSMNIVLVGNKCDLADKREVSLDEGAEFAKQNKLQFMETSAKAGANIKEVFERSAEAILTKIETGEIDPYADTSGIKAGVQETPYAPSTKKLSRRNSIQKRKKCC